MASKKPKSSAANDEIDDLFDIPGIDGGSKKPAKAKPAAASAKPKAGGADQDILAELENQLGEKQPSRPHTPRISKDLPARGSPARRAAGAGTPPPPAERSSEDKPGLGARKSAESTRSFHASFTPSATSSELQESEKKVADPAPAAGGGWWGSIMSTATAAMKQAEIVAKEIQQNEEAKKWTDQLRGNVTALRGYGDDLRHRALPTFTDILHTLAPPISSHERLLIHITHDMAGYPSLDPLIYSVFSRVMAQVEGGDLMVIQRGHENTLRSPSAEKGALFSGPATSSAAGWRDGPWWRASDLPRDLGAVKGLMEGTKLCRTSAEAYSTDYFASRGGVEGARQRALEPVSESNPVRSSDLFLSVQAIISDADEGLFAASKSTKDETSPVAEADAAKDEMVCFAVCILDPIHEIMYHTVSQEMPVKWTQWLDAPAPLTPGSSSDEAEAGSERVPDEIREIVENGGVDPREWVAEWVEEVIGLSVGVVAQRYVARRMGVGEGGIGKGKQRAEVVLQDGGGEAARAGVI